MNALIIEDEIVTQQSLTRMLTQNFPDIRICGILDGVEPAVSWLSTNTSPDVIFMDVELSDGKCFDIFERTTITCPVIMTTAYDNYAVKAFKVNSIDYILKPINIADLARAVERCRNRLSAFDINIESLRNALSSGRSRSYKQRFLLRYNDKIMMVDTSQIAYFYSEEGCSHLMTQKGERYLMDTSLDVVNDELDPSHFFRISRSCIVADTGIGSVAKKLGNRLKLTLKPASDIDSFVSRAKTGDFLNWLEKGN